MFQSLLFFFLCAGTEVCITVVLILFIMNKNSIYRLQDHNMTGKDAYKYFVLRAQEIATSLNWTPVNW